MTPLPVRPPAGDTVMVPGVDCWNRIGIRGDRSCPELPKVAHCQNCPVFAAAGRRFLNHPAPDGYADEWAARLADAGGREAAADLEGVLVFRLADEWLALSVQTLVEVTPPKPIRRVPHRGGVLAGVVNVRGELHLAAHLGKVLGLAGRWQPTPQARMLVAVRDGDRWVLPVDEVDQVHRVPAGAVSRPPATVGRATATLSLGVFDLAGRAVGRLDDARLFEALRTKLR